MYGLCFDRSRQVQVKEGRSQRRVENDRDGQHERDKEARPHIGFHLAGHRWIAHIVTHLSHAGHGMN